jgi:hypothetical protein
MSLRDDLNTSLPGRFPDASKSVGMGDLLNALVTAMTPTETGVSPASNIATLANQPSTLFQVKATAGTTTGVKQLLKGPITGPKAITPATGQVVWDGGKKLLFAAADAVTAVSATYAQATDVTASLFQRTIGESDTL